MKISIKFLFTLLFLTSSISCFAAPSINHGFYLGADLGYGITDCSACKFSVASGTTSHSNTGLAGNIFWGYQLNSYVAFEAGLGALLELQYAINTPSYLEYTTVHTSHVYIAVKALYPISTQWSLFGKLGYDYMQVDDTNLDKMHFDSLNPLGVLLAVGTGYNLNENLALTLAYNQVLASVTRNDNSMNINMRYGSLGLTYLF